MKGSSLTANARSSDSQKGRGRNGGEPTIRDVARMANVSLTTVSNVVNGKFGKMTDETRSAVEEAITALNYRPMANARALRLERRFIAGMLIIDPAASFLSNPFISQIVAGYSNTLWASGYSCLLNGVHPEQIGSSTFFRYAQTDGLCVFQSGSTEIRHATLQRLATLGEPIVAIEEPNLPQGDIASVCQDNREAGRALTREMLGRGAENIWVLTPDWIWPAMQSRIDGIVAATNAEGSGIPVHVVRCGDGHVGEAEVSISRLIENLGPKDCVIAGTDRMLVAMAQSLTRKASPIQPLIAGFRGLSEMSFLPSGLVTIYQPAYALGVEAAHKLIKRIDDGRFSEIETTIAFKPTSLLTDTNTN